MKPLDSGANFVLVPVADSARIENSLRSSGIAVRRFNSLNRIGDALRISIGPWPMMQACLDALAGAVQ
jgi:histidinol-phosphate aminotransferase